MNKKKIEALKNCTGIIIRFDDIAPNMNWLMMDRCEKLLNKFNIKPVLGIIPNNKDQELLSYPKRENFWKIVQNWKSQKWSIAMHGYTHVYDNETNKKDYFNYGGKSEFFGHPLDEQISRIEKGIKIFNDNNIQINTFFAPNHTYDLNTFKALKKSGINQVIDGYGLTPFVFNDIRFIPQLFYKLLLLPLGIQSTQLHVNYWSEKDYKNFEFFIEKNHSKIIDLNTAYTMNSENLFIKFLNIIIEPILKFKRLFRS